MASKIVRQKVRPLIGRKPVGLALQGGLSNFAAGFLIVVFRPFKAGDVINGAGIEGTVEEIAVQEGDRVEKGKLLVRLDETKLTAAVSEAEANFKLGKRDEAINLEGKAMALRPEDEFMRKQVERFKGGKQ